MNCENNTENIEKENEAGSAEVQADDCEVNEEDERAYEKESGEQLVPVSESIKYRKRAQAAESTVREYETRVSALSDEVETLRREIGQYERRERIDQMLLESEVIDLEAGRLLAEMSVSQMDEEDVGLAVEELRRTKPYLFRRSERVGRMPGKFEGRGVDRLSDAAASAAASGDRRDLLRYLRLRRDGA